MCGLRLVSLVLALGCSGLACDGAPERKREEPPADLPIPALDASIAEDFTLAGTLRHAAAIAPSIGDPLDRDETLGSLACAQARGGDLRAALASVEAIGATHTRSAAFEALVRVADEEGLDRSELERRWQASCGGLPHMYRGARAALAGDFERMHRILDESAPAVLVNHEKFLAQIAEQQARSGDVAGARRTAAVLAGTDEEEHAYLSILRAQAEAGDTAGAQETFGRVGFGFFAADALASIAKAQALAGDGAAARENAERAAAAFWQRGVEGWDPASGPVAEALALCGDLAGAELLARRLGESGAFAAAARGAAAGGEEDAARRLLATAHDIASKKSDPLSRRLALEQILWAEADAGFHREALEVGQQLLALGEAGGLDYLARQQAARGDIEGATAVRDLVPSSERWSRARASRAIAQECGARNDAQAARRIAASSSSLLERTWALIGFADGLLALEPARAPSEPSGGRAR
jgi:hypothetical protein